MDELTMERYRHGVPYAEAHARPTPMRRPGAYLIKRRRVDLCGTDDLNVLESGGDRRQSRHQRLLYVIRTWVA